MDIKLGTLEIVPATEHPELLAEAVAKALVGLPDAEKIGVAAIDPQLSDTAAFCERYQVTAVQAANCVVLEAKMPEGGSRYAAVVVLASTRADVNGLARKALEAKKVSFAPMDQAVSRSSMEYGAITPIGLPADWPILIDKAVADAPAVIIGSGLRKSKIAIPGRILAMMPNVRVLEGLGQPRPQ